MEEGITVPFTVVIRNWEPARHLTDEEKGGLGIPFVVKPATGYGQRGIKIINNSISLEEIAEARAFDPGDNFLLQEFDIPANFDGSPVKLRSAAIPVNSL